MTPTAMLDAPPGSDLVERLRASDESALRECYEIYGPTLHSFVQRFVSRDDADDVVQQVFFELWRGRRRLEPNRNPAPLLVHLARQRAIDHLRRRRDDVSVDSVPEPRAQGGDDFVNRLVFASEVREALATLVPEQRECVELVVLQGLTQREAAERLGVPVGTVKARVSRAMTRLALRIEGGDQR
ncbi:MAG: RNA polymerase sigma factor [Acidimicrobiaceae bacterium]|nr:RNA polymerase sigma factor [Acidimicrobiaceae bacterium]